MSALIHFFEQTSATIYPPGLELPVIQAPLTPEFLARPPEIELHLSSTPPELVEAKAQVTRQKTK